MSDTGRQSFADQAGAALKPDSQKSYVEQVGDNVKGVADDVGSTLQPEGEKSTTQKVRDSAPGNKNENPETLTDKAKNAIGLGGKNVGSQA